MNLGIISTRYARALFSLASDNGQEDIVYREMHTMGKQFIANPELRRYLNNPIMKSAEKVDLLEACIGENVSAMTDNFIRFVIQSEKQNYIQYIAMSYQGIYRKAKNIVGSKFVSAQKVDDETLNRIKTLIEKTYSASVDLEVEIDEKLIGGFTLDVENERLDASVLGELHKIKLALGVK